MSLLEFVISLFPMVIVMFATLIERKSTQREMNFLREDCHYSVSVMLNHISIQDQAIAKLKSQVQENKL